MYVFFPKNFNQINSLLICILQRVTRFINITLKYLKKLKFIRIKAKALFL